jgi:TatD DNase family protein
MRIGRITLVQGLSIVSLPQIPQSISPPSLVDSHCHLNLDLFDGDRGDVVARAEAAGVRAIINPGIDLVQSRAALDLARRVPIVHAAVGIHPNSSGAVSEADIDVLRTLAVEPGVLAIGEIGLDFYWHDVEPAQQQAAFESQLALAAEQGLPVIIHSRDANEAVAQTLRRWVAGAHFRGSLLARRPFAGVLHAFSGDAALAEEAYGWGFVLGLGGPVTFRNAHSLHALVPALRLDRLMLETDAPYLTPHPFRGKRNEPAYVALVCSALAALLGMAESDVAAVTTEVAATFYGLQGAAVQSAATLLEEKRA